MHLKEFLPCLIDLAGGHPNSSLAVQRKFIQFGFKRYGLLLLNPSACRQNRKPVDIMRVQLLLASVEQLLVH